MDENGGNPGPAQNIETVSELTSVNARVCLTTVGGNSVFEFPLECVCQSQGRVSP